MTRLLKSPNPCREESSSEYDSEDIAAVSENPRDNPQSLDSGSDSIINLVDQRSEPEISKTTPVSEDPNPLSNRRAAFIERVAVQREKKNKRKTRRIIYRCVTCTRTFPTRNQRDQHFGGISHKKKLNQDFERNQTYFCSTCDQKFNLFHDFDGHNKGRRHRSTLRRVQGNISK